MDVFEISYSCSFSGHRILGKDFNREELKNSIKEVINRGYTTFLVGMAIGFDTECFDLLTNLKKENKEIKIIACLPCKNQDKGFRKEQKQKYQENLKKADEIICLNEEYINGCMQQRNRFMVDNSSVLISYLRYKKGGTVYTVNYAKKKGKEIIYI